MKKSELKTGMVVELRDGRLATVFKDTFWGNDFIVMSENIQASLSNFDEDTLEWYKKDKIVSLTESEKHRRSVDIMKVYIPRTPAKCFSRDTNEMKCIWDRDVEEAKKPKDDAQELGELIHEAVDIFIKNDIDGMKNSISVLKEMSEDKKDVEEKDDSEENSGIFVGKKLGFLEELGWYIE